MSALLRRNQVSLVVSLKRQPGAAEPDTGTARSGIEIRGPGDGVRLLHWNVHMWRDADGGDNKQAIAELIGEIAPDVVSLVEVDEPWGRPEGLQWLAAELGYQWIFIPTFEYRGVGGFGNALLVRPQIRAVQQWHLLSPRLYAGDEPSEPRTVLLAQVGDQPAWSVGSTHLPRLDPDLRAEASARLLQLVGRLSAPWVLCGDFNQPAAAWLPASMVVAPDRPIATHPATEPTDAIDYCIIGGAVAKADVLPSHASDHLPVVVEIAL
jgi:endonuclease/exonuclease/phosphatase family metal-dependent hydrolase